MPVKVINKAEEDVVDDIDIKIDGVDDDKANVQAEKAICVEGFICKGIDRKVGHLSLVQGMKHMGFNLIATYNKKRTKASTFNQGSKYTTPAVFIIFIELKTGKCRKILIFLI